MSCDKFEKLFIQETEDELLEHIKTCEACNFEYKKMQVTEKIIKEAKPYFSAQKRNKIAVNMAASFALVVVSSLVVFNNCYVAKVSYDESVSTAFPVDEYGLLDVR